MRRHLTGPPGGPTRGAIRTARVVALIADALQLGLFPIFAEGAASPVNDVLDIVVCAVLVHLIGWHWVFLPSFAVEVLPVADLAPTWTIAVLLATRGKRDAKALPGDHEKRLPSGTIADLRAGDDTR